MTPSSTSPFDLCTWNLKLRLLKFLRAVSLMCGLGLNKNIKTEFLIIASCHQLAKTAIDSIVVRESSIKPSERVRNLGSWFDVQMRMYVYIGKTCSKTFHGLYK